MGNVRRVITEDLPDDVEGYYWRRGWIVGAVCMFVLWLFTDNDGWHWLWVFLFGEGR